MSRWFRTRAALSVAVVLLATPAVQAATKTVTVAELRADVTRLQALVGACGATTNAAGNAGGPCDPAGVGDDLRVGDMDHGGYEVHWDWLRSALKESKAAAAGKRADLLRESGGQLGRLAAELDTDPAVKAQRQQAAGRSFGAARGDANAVLAQAEFQRDDRPTLWDQISAKIGMWLGKLFAGIAVAGAAVPWFGTFLEWLLAVGAAVGLLFFLLRNLNRQRLRVALEATALQPTAWDREATDWARLAEKHAAAGEWREGVHCLYWAAIVSLEARRAWRHNPTRTPREYLRLLKPGSLHQRGLRGLTRIFERVWYGLRDARAEEYDEARALYEGIASGGVTGESASAGDGALTAGGVA